MAENPPSGSSEERTLGVLYVAAGNIKGGVGYRFILAPIEIEPQILDKLLQPAPEPAVEAVLPVPYAEALFDLLAARETYNVEFGAREIKAGGMDPSHVTQTEVTLIPPVRYKAPTSPVKCEIKDGNRARAIVRAKPSSETVTLAVVGQDLLLDGSKIGEVEDFQEPPELHVNFTVDVPESEDTMPRALSRLMSAEAKKGATAFGIVTVSKRVYLAFYGPKSYGEESDEPVFDQLPVAGYAQKDTVVTGYNLDLVRAIFPASAVNLASKTGAAAQVAMRAASNAPLLIEYSPAAGMEVKYYVAPNPEYQDHIAYGVGMLKPLTEEDVIEAIQSSPSRRATIDDIEGYLRARFIDVSNLRELLGKMRDQRKLIVDTTTYPYYYRVWSSQPQLKPLTEEAVLDALRQFADQQNIQEVGFSELKASLAGEGYDTSPLYDLLKSLEEKGLVEGEEQPKNRPYYAVEPQYYWYLKPAEPEEVVKEAAREELKPLTEDAVIDVLEKMHEEVGLNVQLQDLLNRLVDGGYDTSSFNAVLASLEKEGVVRLTPEGKVFLVEYEKRLMEAPPPPKEEVAVEEVEEEEEEVEKPAPAAVEAKEKRGPPPVPEGFVRVHFLRDIPRYLGMDMRRYGPFRACEVADIEKPFADAFVKNKYVEVVSEAPPAAAAEEVAVEEVEEEEEEVTRPPKTWEEAKGEYMKWRVD